MYIRYTCSFNIVDFLAPLQNTAQIFSRITETMLYYIFYPECQQCLPAVRDCSEAYSVLRVARGSHENLFDTYWEDNHQVLGAEERRHHLALGTFPKTIKLYILCAWLLCWIHGYNEVSRYKYQEEQNIHSNIPGSIQYTIGMNCSFSALILKLIKYN